MQQDLFQALHYDPLDEANAPDYDLAAELVGAIQQSIRKSPYSRAQVVDRINLCLRNSDITVTTVKFNKWLSPSQANLIPAAVLTALSWAVGSNYHFDILVNPLHQKLVHNSGDFIREINEKRIIAELQIKETRALEKQMQQMLEGKY
ncbi:hypothetical protein [Colwellia psychrerythraea]|uniref:Uncharacterized protein n=1 Tax=Colwellia psychrerythraea TaxID=28229 RepID=A0A099KPN7_COLPS|nr:hypothetical protein [Colwellia psychrerythraea]KGJ92145.1 hypothetical protein ND2E_3038 [Colwellia psychrerythraea]